MIVDTEEMERKRAPARTKLQELARGNDYQASLARLGLATQIDDWVVDEVRRGTEPPDICTMVVQRAASLVAGQMATFSFGDKLAALEARQEILDAFNISLGAQLERFDSMSPAERESKAFTLHKPQ